MIDRAHFFATVREHFGALNQSQVDGFGTILDGWERQKDFGDRRWLAYMLATAWHETACTMQPIEEIGKGRGRAYGHPAGRWHKVYDGRGDVQLTWEANYRKASAELAKHGISVDLDRYPERALEPAIAFAIMLYGMAGGWFTGKKLGDYFGSRAEIPSAAVEARRIINGQDRAVIIAGYHRAFVVALTP